MIVLYKVQYESADKDDSGGREKRKKDSCNLLQN